jgi:putative effector of murein hydrolase LrgA (UPF0299 family)
MNHNPPSSSQPCRRLSLASLVAALGAGGTLLIWFEEVANFIIEFIGVIFLPILASLIYLFNVYVFKSAMPKANDTKR